MTAIAFDFGFPRRRNDTWSFSTVANLAFDEFLSINVDESPTFPRSTPVTKIVSGWISSVNQEAVNLLSGVNLIAETTVESRAQEKLILERQILGFLRLEGLADNDAMSLLTGAVPEALIFIEEIPEQIPLPSATIGLDGIVTLEWQSGAKKAAAIFEGEEDYGYAYFDNGKYVPGNVTATAGSGIPEDLTRYLTA